MLIATEKGHGDTALMLASEGKQIELVKLLAEKGADINLRNKKGKTALAMAEDKKYKDIVEYLQSIAAK